MAEIGGIRFRFEADFRELVLAVAEINRRLEQLGAVSSRAEQGLREIGRNMTSTAETVGALSRHLAVLSDVTRNLQGAFASLGTGLLTSQFGQLIRQASDVAARVDVFSSSLRVAGQNAGLLVSELSRQVEAIRRLGITTQEAHQSLRILIQSEIDVSKAAELARTAQDLAAGSLMNSSEAFGTLTAAIANQFPILLRQFGIVTNLDEIYREYARAAGVAASSLDETQRKQAFLNKVLEEGEKVAGTYLATMENAGKQIGSFARFQEEALRVVGEKFQPALLAVVLAANQALAAFERAGSGVHTLTAVLLAAGTTVAAATAAISGLAVAMRIATAATGGAVTGFQALVAVLGLANPKIGLLLAALGAVGAGVAAYVASVDTARRASQQFAESQVESSTRVLTLARTVAELQAKAEPTGADLVKLGEAMEALRRIAPDLAQKMVEAGQAAGNLVPEAAAAALATVRTRIAELRAELVELRELAARGPVAAPRPAIPGFAPGAEEAEVAATAVSAARRAEDLTRALQALAMTEKTLTLSTLARSLKDVEGDLDAMTGATSRQEAAYERLLAKLRANQKFLQDHRGEYLQAQETVARFSAAQDLLETSTGEASQALEEARRFVKLYEQGLREAKVAAEFLAEIIDRAFAKQLDAAKRAAFEVETTQLGLRAFLAEDAVKRLEIARASADEILRAQEAAHEAQLALARRQQAQLLEIEQERFRRETLPFRVKRARGQTLDEADLHAEAALLTEHEAQLARIVEEGEAKRLQLVTKFGTQRLTEERQRAEELARVMRELHDRQASAAESLAVAQARATRNAFQIVQAETSQAQHTLERESEALQQRIAENAKLGAEEKARAIEMIEQTLHDRLRALHIETADKVRTLRDEEENAYRQLTRDKMDLDQQWADHREQVARRVADLEKEDRALRQREARSEAEFSERFAELEERRRTPQTPEGFRQLERDRRRLQQEYQEFVDRMRASREDLERRKEDADKAARRSEEQLRQRQQELQERGIKFTERFGASVTTFAEATQRFVAGVGQLGAARVSSATPGEAGGGGPIAAQLGRGLDEVMAATWREVERGAHAEAASVPLPRGQFGDVQVGDRLRGSLFGVDAAVASLETFAAELKRAGEVVVLEVKGTGSAITAELHRFTTKELTQAMMETVERVEQSLGPMSAEMAEGVRDRLLTAIDTIAQGAGVSSETVEALVGRVNAAVDSSVAAWEYASDIYRSGADELRLANAAVSKALNETEGTFADLEAALDAVASGALERFGDAVQELATPAQTASEAAEEMEAVSESAEEAALDVDRMGAAADASEDALARFSTVAVAAASDVAQAAQSVASAAHAAAAAADSAQSAAAVAVGSVGRRVSLFEGFEDAEVRQTGLAAGEIVGRSLTSGGQARVLAEPGEVVATSDQARRILRALERIERTEPGSLREMAQAAEWFREAIASLVTAVNVATDRLGIMSEGIGRVVSYLTSMIGRINQAADSADGRINRAADSAVGRINQAADSAVGRINQVAGFTDDSATSGFLARAMPVGAPESLRPTALTALARASSTRRVSPPPITAMDVLAAIYGDPTAQALLAVRGMGLTFAGTRWAPLGREASFQMGLLEPPVPGPRSRAVPVWMHGGERGVTPEQESQIVHQLRRLERGERGVGAAPIVFNTTVHVQGAVTDEVMVEFDRKLKERIRRNASEALQGLRP